MKNLLNPTQLAAVDATDPLLLIVAGPGSGKTRTLIEKIAHTINKGVPAEKIVCITFTNAGADEIKKRLKKGFFEQPVTLGYCGTLHGFMFRLLTQSPQVVGYRPGISIIDETAAEELLKAEMEAQRYRGTFKDLTEAFGDYWKGVGRTMTPQQRIVSGYYQALRDGNMMDFDAILRFGLKLVLKEPPQQFSHLFVDEAQDSGELDFAIYNAIPAEQKVIIGDPDQSIFGFRGADVKQFITTAQKAKVITLEANYRCGEAICWAAQRLIQHNSDRLAKETVAATTRQGCVEVREMQNPITESTWIAADIARHGNPSTAVLCRTNHLANELAKTLEAQGIRVAKKDRTEVPQDWARTCLMISFLANPFNDVLAYRYLCHAASEPKAKEAKAEAGKQLCAINSVAMKLPRHFPALDVPNFLVSHGASTEAVERVCMFLNQLREPATIADLLLLMHSEVFHKAELGDGVVVTTIHSAKGREWEVVYLPAFEQQIIPAKNELDEERRLAYVGVTRTIERLVITFCVARKAQWEPKATPRAPSQFIREMNLTVP